MTKYEFRVTLLTFSFNSTFTILFSFGNFIVIASGKWFRVPFPNKPGNAYILIEC